MHSAVMKWVAVNGGVMVCALAVAALASSDMARLVLLGPAEREDFRCFDVVFRLPRLEGFFDADFNTLLGSCFRASRFAAS